MMMCDAPSLTFPVRRLQREDREVAGRWDDFVQACPGATFFHRAGWQGVIEQVFHHATYYLYVEIDGRIQAVLPLAHVKSWLFGSSLTSLAFTVYGGVASLNSEATQVLELEAQRIAKSLGVSHLEFRNVEAQHVDWPRQDLYVTFRKPLLADAQANLQAVPRKQRAMVRKGIKYGLGSELDASVDRFFALFSDNVHRHGTPSLPKSYFMALQQAFGRDCEILTVVAPDGRALSSVMSFYFRDEVLPYYAGDCESARAFCANDFKYWELMRRACERGIKVFDYGRSKRGSGSYAFKKNWGFEAQALNYEYQLYKRDAVPQNNPNNAKYRLLIRAWRLMPLALATRLGPWIVRGLG